MTKADLVEEVTQLGDLTRRDGEMIVDTIFDSVIHALRSGDKIEIRGFGSFRIRQRKPRTGRNPKTGAKVDVPAKRVPYFKPSKELRDLVNPKDHSPEPGAGNGEGHSGERSTRSAQRRWLDDGRARGVTRHPDGRLYTRSGSGPEAASSRGLSCRVARHIGAHRGKRSRPHAARVRFQAR